MPSQRVLLSVTPNLANQLGMEAFRINAYEITKYIIASRTAGVRDPETFRVIEMKKISFDDAILCLWRWHEGDLHLNFLTHAALGNLLDQEEIELEDLKEKKPVKLKLRDPQSGEVDGDAL